MLLLTLICGKKKKKNGGGGEVDGFVAAGKGKQGFVRATQWLEQEENVVIPPLAV